MKSEFPVIRTHVEYKKTFTMDDGTSLNVEVDIPYSHQSDGRIEEDALRVLIDNLDEIDCRIERLESIVEGYLDMLQDEKDERSENIMAQALIKKDIIQRHVSPTTTHPEEPSTPRRM